MLDFIANVVSIIAKKIHRAAASQPTSRLLMALAALAREVSHVLVGLLMVSVVALQGFVERALRIAELAGEFCCPSPQTDSSILTYVSMQPTWLWTLHLEDEKNLRVLQFQESGSELVVTQFRIAPLFIETLPLCE